MKRHHLLGKMSKECFNRSFIERLFVWKDMKVFSIGLVSQVAADPNTFFLSATCFSFNVYGS